MKLIPFPEHNIVIAKDQPEYLAMPAYRFHLEPTARIVCCWQLTWWERVRLLFTGVLWHQIMTFNKPIQPQQLSVVKPEMP